MIDQAFSKDVILEALDSGPKTLEQLIALLKASKAPLHPPSGLSSYEALAKHLSWTLADEGLAFFNDKWLLERIPVAAINESLMQACLKVFPQLNWKCCKYSPHCKSEFSITTDNSLKVVLELTAVQFGRSCVAYAYLEGSISNMRLSISETLPINQPEEVLVDIKGKLSAIAQSIQIPTDILSNDNYS